MASWDDGYVTDIGYPLSFNREMTPSWLAMTALLMGHRPPDLSRPFRYADLGCGNGVTAVVVAATCPQAEVWGFDFNPTHVESARRLAERAGLANATFVETSFADLARRAARDLPELDFIVSHGVLSWISPTNRHHLIDLIGRRLRPGGLAYLGYNAAPGWASMVPIRALMRLLLLGSEERSDLAVAGILDVLERIKQAGALYFQMHPMLDQQLAGMRQRDPRYVAHEYLNEHWHPLMFAEVADEMMAQAKCTFIGSTGLSSNIESVSVPAAFAPVLAEAQDLYLKETLRDIACAQSFRKDLYRRGVTPLLPGEYRALSDALSIVGLGQPIEDEIKFPTPTGSVVGQPEIYRPLLAMLEKGPVSTKEAQNLKELAGRPEPEVMIAFAMLVAGGYALPRLPQGGSPSARQTARTLNLAIAESNACGGEFGCLAAPVVGGAIPIGLIEHFVVGAILEDRSSDADHLADRVMTQMARGGRRVQQNGQVVTDQAAARRIIADNVRATLDQRGPVFRLLGILDD
jgi:SAM-dependent methyltransferase